MKNINAKCKICRREGQRLFLKGERCYTQKCPMVKKKYPSGIHGRRTTRITEYGEELREKQKVKMVYGLREKQFKNYYKKAEKMKGMTTANLSRLLECRLDNVIFRLGFTYSRDQARKFISHGHFLINNRKVNLPSHQVKKGDVIEVKEKSKKNIFFRDIAKKLKSQKTPPWLSLDIKNLKGKVEDSLNEKDIESDINWSKIIEFYSR